MLKVDVCPRAMMQSSSKHNGNDNINTSWTQEELDLFISKNDWGSVAEYINEMRASKGSGNKKQLEAIRKELSMREIQRTIEHNLQSSAPKKKSTEHRRIQYDDVTSDSPSSPSACLESESLWQSLSSASESEESSRRGPSYKK
jgi:hypothetical protein